ncbi:hypothetical protein HT031_000907 [Scenedesmus sp. PABB004]|nr:hypothetical protein HT031_000907 [Scenedesmus sp. PABB004]
MEALTVSGPTLAALLASCIANGRPCDGLLIGEVDTTVTMQAHDTADALVVEESVARLAGCCACAGTHSFYTNSGAVVGAQRGAAHAHTHMHAHARSELPSAPRRRPPARTRAGDRLAALVEAAGGGGDGAQQQRLLGWFSFRPGTPCTPSMREAAVTRSLQDWADAAARREPRPAWLAPGGQPLVFGLVSSGADHNAATISLPHKFFRLRREGEAPGGGGSRPAASGGGGRAPARGPEHPTLAALALTVHNLGQTAMTKAAAGGGAASSWGSAALPALGCALAPPGGGGLGAELQAQLASASAAAAGEGVGAVEALYRGLLDELAAAAASVAAKQAALDALRERNADLEAGAVERAARACVAGAAAANNAVGGVDLL